MLDLTRYSRCSIGTLLKPTARVTKIRVLTLFTTLAGRPMVPLEQVPRTLRSSLRTPTSQILCQVTFTCPAQFIATARTVQANRSKTVQTPAARPTQPVELIRLG